MIEITGRTTGNLKMELTHTPSGATLRTAAPRDNNGDGSSFSPTDLVAAALGACMVTVMGIAAAREQIPFDEVSFRVEKHMASNPRRIDRLPVTIRMPVGLDERQRKLLENTALTCPVHQSLAKDLERAVTFEYPSENG